MPNLIEEWEGECYQCPLSKEIDGRIVCSMGKTLADCPLLGEEN